MATMQRLFGSLIKLGFSIKTTIWNLTFRKPRETLQFVAKLYEGYSRMTPEMSTRVETLIAKLGLKDCADRIIGVPDGNHTCGKANNGAGGSSTQGSSSSTQRTQQSISGGERRRVSVAMQLLTNPSVLFCDEPTSGLDAFASFELWKTLTHLAKSEHKTVVVSAHQPRSEVFQLLAENQGQLVMLSLGQVVYSGPIDEALDWFARQPDVPSCLKNINPFDYLMDLCGVNHTSEQQEEESRQRHKSLVKAWNEAVPSKIPDCVESTQPTLSSSSSCSRQPAPSAWKTMKNIGSHTIILAHRGLMSQARNKTWVVAFVLCYGLIGLWTGAIFHRLSISILGIRARHLAVMLFVNMCPMSCMAAMLYRLCHDVRTFDRERKDRWYGPLAFVLASVLKNMPLAFLGTTVLTSGTHVPYDKIPDALVWTKYINYMADTFKVLLSAEFSDREFDCPFDIGVGVRDPVRCQWYDGNEYLRMNGNIQPHYYPGPVFIILVHAIALTLISWLLFAFKEVEPSAAVEPNNFLAALIYLVKAPFASNDLSKSTLESSDGPKKSLQSIRGTQQQSLDKKEEADIEDEKYEETRIHMYGKTLAQCDPVEIRVDKVSLSSSVKATQDEVKYRGLLPRCIASCFQPAIRSQRHILKEIDLRFVPGELTAILGASGAGKTSLANTILHRSPAHLQRQGDIWFNGSKNPTLRQINAVCGHVRQDDSFLHSHLTVRETLRYAAELSVNCKDRRSDTCEGQPSLAEAWNKAEVIMELMGLYECADVFVGGPGVTGCSGGQRRRLSIALQLLLEPACLILDEPTTGLDATSALSLIQTLKTIARTGRTIICTIHQPRAAIWDEFDQVVLLLPGGRVGYAGRRESILDFFASAGMERPESVNIPDFIIDTASINYASETTESETRQHITRLAAEFQKYRVQNVTRLSSQLKGHHESSSADTADSTSINVQELSEEKTPHYTPIMRAVPILSRRMFTNEVRQTSLFLNRACLGFMVGLVPSAMAVHMDWTLSGLMMRTFFINQLVFVSLTGVFAVVSLFPKQ
ncbi:ATP-binding cassette sub- G member 5, partial [Actinomortierella ambigua]